MRGIRPLWAALLCMASAGWGTGASDADAAGDRAASAPQAAAAQVDKPAPPPSPAQASPAPPAESEVPAPPPAERQPPPPPLPVKSEAPAPPPAEPEAPAPPPADPGGRQVVEMELQGQEDTEPKLGYGNCQWLYPHDEPQEKSLDEPDYASDKPVYYAAQYGDAEENVYSFVIDESGGPGAGYDVVYIDANNDNRLDPEEERFEFHVGTPAHADPVRIRLLVTAGGVTAPYHVNFKAFTYSTALSEK